MTDLASEMNRAPNEAKGNLANTLRRLASYLNFLQRNPTDFLQSSSNGEQAGISSSLIEAQIAARVAAKNAKDFAQADQIRKTLLEQGVVLEDKPGGMTEWRRA